ncbi:hypothetical protein BSKO_10222 [Bryopsis sp. KO-2023]|nr:hypothetical protein BSKO_10222 [Bryopsis sp. KO-2023]
MHCATFSPSIRSCNRRAATTVCRAKYKNPLGLHSSVWTGTWEKAAAENAIRRTKELGYQLIEVSVGEPETIDAEMTKSILEDNGLAASGSLGLRFDADISSEDPECSRRGKELLIASLKKVHGFGGNFLSGVTHSAMGKYDQPATKANWENSVKALREVGSMAQDLDIDVGLEVVNRYESNLVNTASQAMEMVSDIGLPNVVVHMDSYHMNIEEDSMEAGIRTCAANLGYVHIGEAHRGYLGTGSVDFDGLFSELMRVGFDGPIVFESFSSEVVTAALSNALSVWRNMWKDSSDLASHAYAVMDGKLTSAWIKASRENSTQQ